MSLMIDLAVMRYALKTDTRDMRDLNGFHKLINCSNLNGVAFTDFAMCRRENSTYKKLSESLMHNLHLGKINALLRCWFFN